MQVVLRVETPELAERSTSKQLRETPQASVASERPWEALVSETETETATSAQVQVSSRDLRQELLQQMVMVTPVSHLEVARAVGWMEGQT